MQFANATLQEKILSAPLSPGCYIYRNKNNVVLYVGKAKVLRNRVKSYFQKTSALEAKIQLLVAKIHSVEFVTTDSELEALLLETNLIKKYKPKYNSEKKDDKNYVWLMLEKNLDFPKFKVVREKKKKSAEYFGPYPSTVPLKRVMRMLRKVFPYRTCNRKIEEIVQVDKEGKQTKVIKSSDPKPCLYYYLGLCQAPCAGEISKAEYVKNTRNIKRFFKSEKEKVIKELSLKMQKLSAVRKYEQAALIRDQLNDLNYINQKISIKHNTDEELYRKTKTEKRIQALEEIVGKLDEYSIEVKKGFKMECYDISNISGKQAVGSMVVFVDGKPEKSLYRKFKIKTKDTPDDFEMMREVLGRRFNSKRDTDKSFSTLPDLIVIDGGKGQLSSAYQVMLESGKFVPMIGLAKKNEEIFMVKEIEEELTFKKRTLRAGSESKFLIQRLRDESHRFAISYHRKLRGYKQNRSVLDDIPGVGNIVKRKLLQAFGSVEGIKKASASEIQQVIKNKKTVAAIKKIL